MHPFMPYNSAIPAKYCLGVPGKGAVTGAGCQCLTRECLRERISWLDAKRCISTTLIFDVATMKESVIFAALLMDQSQVLGKVLQSLVCSLSYHWKDFCRSMFGREKLVGTYLQNFCHFFFLFYSMIL